MQRPLWLWVRPLPKLASQHLPKKGHSLLPETEVKVRVVEVDEGRAFAKPIPAEHRTRESQS